MYNHKNKNKTKSFVKSRKQKVFLFREKNLLIDSKILITPVNDRGKIVKMPIEMLDKLQLSKI